MTFDEVVSGRRSVRKYEAKPLEREKLLAVLEAGRLAPSARNDQAWHFTAVVNDPLRQALAEACCGQAMVGAAPAALVVWAHYNRNMTCGLPAAHVDCAIAMTHMVLKAADLGLGTCWLGAFEPEAVRRVLGLPDEAVVVAVTPLGYPAETPAPRPRKPAEEIYDIRE